MPETRHIAMTEIDPPDNPMRVAMDDTKLADLRKSMASIGLIHPLAVWERDGRYVIEAGHRRFVAASELGWEKVRCEVYSKDELKQGAVMLAENIFKEETSAAEEALLFQDYYKKHDSSEAGMCAHFHVSPDYIGDRLRLLRGDREVFDALLNRSINFSVARELNKCTEEGHRRYLLGIAVDTGYSAAVMASQVREWKKNQHYLTQPVLPASEQPAPEPVAEYRQECCICGGYRDPWAMESVMIHRHELQAIRDSLRNAAQGEPA